MWLTTDFEQGHDDIEDIREAPAALSAKASAQVHLETDGETEAEL